MRAGTANARALAGGRTDLPTSLAPSRDSTIPLNPFGSGNRLSSGQTALGPVGTKSQASSNSIRTITHSLMLIPYGPKRADKLIKGDVAVVGRIAKAYDNRYYIMDLSQFNQLCREQFALGKKALLSTDGSGVNALHGMNDVAPSGLPLQPMGGHFRSTSPTQDLSSLPLNRLAAARYGEEYYTPTVRVLENLSEYAARGLDAQPTESEILEELRQQFEAAGENLPDDIDEQIEAARKREAAVEAVHSTFNTFLDSHGRYLSLDGIMNTWNVMGPVNNTSWDRSDEFRSESNTPTVNFALTRYATVYNRWGAGVRQGALLGYILKRELATGPDGKEYEEFARVPYYSNEREYPTAKDLMFRNIDGTIEMGHFFPLASAHNLPTQNASTSQCREALGLDNTPFSVARERNAMLDKIEVLVRHRI